MRLNRITNLVWVVSISVVIVFALGCKKQPVFSSAVPAYVPIDASNPQLVSETEKKERDALAVKVRALAHDGDFQQLETMADGFRSHKSRFKDGDWKLRVFYNAFGNYRDIPDDDAYGVLVSQLETWAVQQPHAITPRLALVEAYHGYAWKARGSGSGAGVTDQAAQLMGVRLEKGFSWLERARELQAKANDPAFYATALHLFLGANVDRKIYEQVFDEGVKNAPDYYALYEWKAYYLLPRWYGQPGEWESYAREISKRDDLPDHEELYARIALYLHGVGCFYEEFSYNDRSWAELKTSVHALEDNDPEALEINSTFCLMCVKMHDYQEARVQAKMLGGQVDLSLWGSQKNFENAINWMNQDDATLEASRQKFLAKYHRPQ